MSRTFTSFQLLPLQRQLHMGKTCYAFSRQYCMTGCRCLRVKFPITDCLKSDPLQITPQKVKACATKVLTSVDPPLTNYSVPMTCPFRKKQQVHLKCPSACLFKPFNHSPNTKLHQLDQKYILDKCVQVWGACD